MTADVRLLVRQLHRTCRSTPFQALRVSYGMLLGEDDFRVLMGNPRGKQMLHSAWLHGSGVVWGYRVATEVPDQGPLQLRVSPGLAWTAWVARWRCRASACLNLRDWLRAHDEPPRPGRLRHRAPCTPAWSPSSTAA